MNKLILSLILLLGTSLLCLAQTTNSMQQRHVMTGQWKLIQYRDIVNNRIVDEPSNLNRSVVLKFEDDAYQGHIEGHTIRNRISAQYYLRKNNSINFKYVGTQGNDNGEKEWGDNLSRLLLDVNSYKIQKDTLTLKYDSGTKAMIFILSDERQEKGNSIYK
jgi:hypothetical protein